MAKNTGKNYRIGAVKDRSQVKTPVTGNFTKRDGDTGRFTDQKEGGKPFKGVRTER